MVMELERYMARVRSLGLEDVASDVGILLEKHRNELPPYLPGAVEAFPSDKFTFVYNQQCLPITPEVLEDPKYTTVLIRPVLELGLQKGKYSIGLVTRATNGFLRNLVWDPNLSRYRSMAELMAISDNGIPRMRTLGKKSVSLFRDAILMLRERFIKDQVEPGAH